MTIDWKPTEDDHLREQAIREWNKRRDFRIRLVSYLMVNVSRPGARSPAGWIGCAATASGAVTLR